MRSVLVCLFVSMFVRLGLVKQQMISEAKSSGLKATSDKLRSSTI